jgi:2,5-diamino-6-(ribosylamino)-4(3H)-pyrimidinone 5'-phosphate reductase
MIGILKMIKPITTLFSLMSIDGKISTGSIDALDVDKDFPRITGVKEGLYQYYDLEQETDLYSLNSGRVLAKVGMNNKRDDITKLPVSFLVIDNQPHLTNQGIENLLLKSRKLFIITTNKKHPAFESKQEANLEILYYEKEIDFIVLFQKLKTDFAIENLTIQTGGTLNSIFLRQKLIDKLSLVVAPILIGGKDTTALIDGVSLTKIEDLVDLKALKLEKVTVLKDSYLHLQYEIINETKVLL